MYSATDIRDLSSAIETRDAIDQASHYQASGAPRAASTGVSGPRYRLEDAGKSVPVFDNYGNVFAQSSLSEGTALKIPENIALGSIIEYQDLNGQTFYGSVVRTRKKKHIEVKTTSAEDVEKMKLSNPGTKIYAVGDEDAKPHKASNQAFGKLLSLLDPEDSFIFKLLTMLLVGNLFESESLTDIFMMVYVRILAIAVAMIVVVYVSTMFVPS